MQFPGQLLKTWSCHLLLGGLCAVWKQHIAFYKVKILNILEGDYSILARESFWRSCRLGFCLFTRADRQPASSGLLLLTWSVIPMRCSKNAGCCISLPRRRGSYNRVLREWEEKLGWKLGPFDTLSTGQLKKGTTIGMRQALWWVSLLSTYRLTTYGNPPQCVIE